MSFTSMPVPQMAIMVGSCCEVMFLPCAETTQAACALNSSGHHDHALPVCTASPAAKCPNACSCGCWDDTYTFGGGQKHHHSRIVPGPRCSSRLQGDDMCKATFSGAHFWYQGRGSRWWLQPGTYSTLITPQKYQQVETSELESAFVTQLSRQLGTDV